MSDEDFSDIEREYQQDTLHTARAVLAAIDRAVDQSVDGQPGALSQGHLEWLRVQVLDRIDLAEAKLAALDETDAAAAREARASIEAGEPLVPWEEIKAEAGLAGEAPGA